MAEHPATVRLVTAGPRWQNENRPVATLDPNTMKMSPPALTPAAWRRAIVVASLLALGLAGCAGGGGMGSGVTTTSDGPRARTPAEERVIAGVADIILSDRAWPDFDRALPNRINTVSDGAPLYIHIRTSRPLQDLAHPADPNASAPFARYPYLLLQVGDADSMRIVNTCYVTLTPEEGQRTELVVPLAPMVRRPGNSPTDCWLATVSSQPPGRLRQEIRLAGFAGKFERWLPVPDILAVAQIDADLTAGSAQYSGMLRSPSELSFNANRPPPGSSLGPVGGAAASPGGAGSGSALGPVTGANSAPSPSAPRPLGGSAAPPATTGSAAVLSGVAGGAAGARPPSPGPYPGVNTSTVPSPSPFPAPTARPAPSPLPAPSTGSSPASSPAATSAPIVLATPVPGIGQPRPVASSSLAPVRASMGGERLEAQLQALATALLGRRPSETYFTDNYWVPAADQRGQYVAEQAFAAAVFRGSTCSWARLRVLRRPGGANIADIERAGDFQDVHCETLR